MAPTPAPPWWVTRCGIWRQRPRASAKPRRPPPRSLHYCSHPALITEDACLKLLSSYSNSGSPERGVCLHGPIIKLGFHGHLLLCNLLLSCYTKCGSVDGAHKLFDESSNRDVITWTSLISAFSRRRKYGEALELFRLMLAENSSALPNEFTYSSVLRCASSLKALGFGMQAHAQILKCGLVSNEAVASSLADVYSNCGELEEALKTFSLIDSKDVISWTTIISAHAEAGDHVGAVRLYTSMIKSAMAPSAFTFARLLTASGSSLNLQCGMMLHAHLILWGIELNLILKTTLVDMYSKCRRMNDATSVFLQTPESDVMLWTTMISGYTQANNYQEAFFMFHQMECRGLAPNSFTYAAIISTCSYAAELKLGKQIHCKVLKAGMEHDASVGNSLVDFYGKFSFDIEDPTHAFRAIVSPNVISWTVFIAALASHGSERDAAMAFMKMRSAGVHPNSLTVYTFLKGCISTESLVHARELHAHVIKTEVELLDLSIGNSLVDVYARLGKANDAWVTANTMMPYRDVLTYTSLSKGFNKIGLHRRALDMISYMHEEDVRIDDFCLACFISAAAGLAEVECGNQLHCYATKSALLSWISVSNSLVDMYGKCGRIEEARKVFMTIQAPNVVSWNGLISGLISNSQFLKALSTFEDMILASAQPDNITFLLVLHACSHGGLVDSGVDYFNSMEDLYGVMPGGEHYVCLVDMLGRAGRLEEATCLIETMPFQPDSVIFKMLLASCKHHHNLALGEFVARRALEIDPSDPGIYMLLAGIYEDAGKLEWGEQTRMMMRENAMKKSSGQIWTESR